MPDLQSFDVVAVGTGFATSFFLHRLLTKSKRDLSVLVLEAGELTPHSELIERPEPHKVHVERTREAASLFRNTTPQKRWNFTRGFGGSSVCWFACTPRMLPEDFRMRTTYGVATDWPITYEELEPYYCDAEEMMNVSGSNERPGPWPMSREYPQRPHSYSVAAKLFKQAFPDQFYPQATARRRDACCASNVCGFCPVDAKYTIENGMPDLYRDARITLRYRSPVRGFDYDQSAVRSVTYLDLDTRREVRVKGDLIVLGANAIFNPYIMMRSGLRDRSLGKGICESVTVPVEVEFESLQNYQGSTIVAGQGFMLYSGEHRRSRAAALMQVDNRVRVSPERGRWLSRMRLLFAFEDLRREDNLVEPSSGMPIVTYLGRSDYCDRGIGALRDDVSRILDRLPVPVREYSIGAPWTTDSHIQGTHVMGEDPADSVVDRACVHHRLRNLVVLGGGTFPTVPPANPTLTICAISLMAADRLS